MSYNIPYGKQCITAEDIAAVCETLQSNALTQGPKVGEFEEEFAKYVGARYAIAVSNATAALHLCVRALGLKPGQRVITTPITFAASANCARYVDAEVWFVDIDPETYLISFDQVRRLIESKPAGFFSGIIVVDFAGLPVDTEKFKELADKHQLWLLEDACHAPGAYFKDRHGNKIMCGDCHYSDMATFSFHPVKHITCGEGGMITTNSSELAATVKKLRSHGIERELLPDSHGGWYYELQDLGYNYRLTDIQCALGKTQLAKNPTGVLRRNQIAQIYNAAFQGILKTQIVHKEYYNAYHLFVIEYKNRKKLYDSLKTSGIFTQVHYIPLHIMPYYRKFDHTPSHLEYAEHYYANCLSLPMYPTLSDQEVEYVIREVKRYAV